MAEKKQNRKLAKLGIPITKRAGWQAKHTAKNADTKHKMGKGQRENAWKNTAGTNYTDEMGENKTEIINMRCRPSK